MFVTDYFPARLGAPDLHLASGSTSGYTSSRTSLYLVWRVSGNDPPCGGLEVGAREGGLKKKKYSLLPEYRQPIRAAYTSGEGRVCGAAKVSKAS